MHTTNQLELYTTIAEQVDFFAIKILNIAFWN